MQPKLLMARAAAPMFRGLRVATRTTRRLSKSAGEFIAAILRHYDSDFRN